MITKEETEEVLNDFFDKLIREARKNLKKDGSIASKNLYRSLKKDVQVSLNSFAASLSAADYWKFINWGVKGIKSGKSLKGYRYTRKKPPLRFMRTWIKQKSGVFRSRDLRSQSFAVQNTVYQKGIKPTEFISKPFEILFRRLPDELIEAYGLDVEEFLKFTLEDGK